MAKMIESKGAEYVAAWPASIARMNKRTEAEVRAIAEQTYPGQAIGTYETWQAKHVANQVAALNPKVCHYCGLPLTGGRCSECV